jgi:hypothetical protein
MSAHLPMYSCALVRNFAFWAAGDDSELGYTLYAKSTASRFRSASLQ